MLSSLAGRLVARNMSRLREGDVSPTLAIDADDVRLRFPGRNSWAGVHDGKPAVEAWLRRFAETGLQIYADEVVVKGFPWRQTLCVRGTDHLDTPAGERVYENRYVIWGTIRWGRLRDYEVYEDTERTRALDEYLNSVGKL